MLRGLWPVVEVRGAETDQNKPGCLADVGVVESGGMCCYVAIVAIGVVVFGEETENMWTAAKFGEPVEDLYSKMQ